MLIALGFWHFTQSLLHKLSQATNGDTNEYNFTSHLLTFLHTSRRTQVGLWQELPILLEFYKNRVCTRILSVTAALHTPILASSIVLSQDNPLNCLRPRLFSDSKSWNVDLIVLLHQCVWMDWILHWREQTEEYDDISRVASYLRTNIPQIGFVFFSKHYRIHVEDCKCCDLGAKECVNIQCKQMFLKSNWWRLVGDFPNSKCICGTLKYERENPHPSAYIRFHRSSVGFVKMKSPLGTRSNQGAYATRCNTVGA